ncbi:MAG: transketolase [Chloroflexi bacterium]|nr:transketolase [Chloroflexota bacterium]
MTATATDDTMRDRFADVTSKLLDEDPRLAVVMADIGGAGFVEAKRRHPDRIMSIGIREQLMISVVSGLALSGMRPIAHSYTPFLIERPFEQVKLDLAHQGVGAVLVSVGASYDASDSGRTHQAPEDVALLSSLPDWTIHVPGHPDEAELLLRDAVAADGNVYLRLAAQSNAAPMPIEPGRFHVVRRGSQATVIAVGPMLDRTLEATSDLDVTVLYATTVRPFDADTLHAQLSAPVVALVEPYLQGTSAMWVSEAFRDMPHRLLSIGVRRMENRHYGTPEQHDEAHCLDVASLRHRIGQFLEA